MGNMGYCRFENTLHDLYDCNEYIWDNDLSESEEKARKALIALCREIADEHLEEDD